MRDFTPSSFWRGHIPFQITTVSTDVLLMLRRNVAHVRHILRLTSYAAGIYQSSIQPLMLLRLASNFEQKRLLEGGLLHQSLG